MVSYTLDMHIGSIRGVKMFPLTLRGQWSLSLGLGPVLGSVKMTTAVEILAVILNIIAVDK